MGCCVSTQKGKGATAGTTKHRLHHHTTSPAHSHHHVSKSPPRAEEEAVKEVLSETPIILTTDNPMGPGPGPDPNPNPNPYYYTPIPKINHGTGFPTAILAATNNHQIRHRSASPRKRLHHTDEINTTFPPPPMGFHPKVLSPPSPPPPAVDEISEVSEISCLSESVSTATAADGEVRQRAPRSPSPGRIHRTGPFSADSAFRRERIAGKSPVKRSDPSPRRAGPGRESGHVMVRNRVVGPVMGDGVRRREAGEHSGRRSRSPGSRNEGFVSRSNVGRSPSGRKTGISPGRVRMVQPGSGPVKTEESGVEESWDPNPTQPTESLENPLVSLECFIFL